MGLSLASDSAELGEPKSADKSINIRTIHWGDFTTQSSRSTLRLASLTRASEGNVGTLSFFMQKPNSPLCPPLSDVS